MSTVTINGATVDAADPCALYQALYAVKLQRLAGEAVEETEIRSPSTQRRMRFASMPMAALDDELAALKRDCEAVTGGPRVRRKARSVRWA